MSYTAAVETATIQQWISTKLEPKTIEQELIAKGLDADAVAAHLAEYKRVKNAKRQTTGFICMAVGAFLGFISCVLTLVNPIPELYNLILYGLTSLAILVIFWGLYFVFE
jgi:hypothetical protein